MRIAKQFLISMFFMLALLTVGVDALAQQAPATDKLKSKSDDVIIFEREISGPQQGTGIRVPMTPGDDTVVFLSSEMSFDGKVVKGSPYSAQAVTESTRTLSDGNRIKSKTTATVYRDGEGRTRRDQELGAVGPWAMSGDPHQTVFINDPVAGVNYILDPRTRIARKMAPFRVRVHSANGAQGSGDSSKVEVRVEREVFTARVPGPAAGGAGMHEFHIKSGPRKGETESLGKQTVEGVLAEGTRHTVTIPAGEMGNEQPINIVSEKWYSPELQAVVMSKHNDPLVGETVYRLTNILRGEPARSLFEVPGDYTIKENSTHIRGMKKRSAGEN